MHILFVGFTRILWKEVYECCARPIPLSLILGLSIGATLAAGNLNIKPPTIRVQLYDPGPHSHISPGIQAARDILREYSDVHVIDMSGPFLDLKAMQRDGAQYAIVPRGENWVVFYNFPTLLQEQESAWFVNLLATSLSVEKPLITSSSPSAIAKIGLSSRASALPRDSTVLFIPRTISLIILFVPFVLSARSVSREIYSEALSTILAGPSGGWTSLLAAKAVASWWVSMLILLVLILVIRPIFGITPKPGLLIQLGAQGIAVLTSAALGLFAAISSRNQSQTYIFVSIYFLALVLLSGFLFSLETASPVIRAASNLSPLTYSSTMFENWLFYGTDARVFGFNIVLLGGQLAVATAALIFASLAARRRI